MGFIPIFLTLGGAVMLFIMVVRQSLANKKQQFDALLNVVAVGLTKLSSNQSVKADLSTIKSFVQEVKPKLKPEELSTYEALVKTPLNQAKLTRLQYNQLISKKPYSFVAKIFGYEAI